MPFGDEKWHNFQVFRPLQWVILRPIIKWMSTTNLFLLRQTKVRSLNLCNFYVYLSGRKPLCVLWWTMVLTSSIVELIKENASRKFALSLHSYCKWRHNHCSSKLRFQFKALGSIISRITASVKRPIRFHSGLFRENSAVFRTDWISSLTLVTSWFLGLNQTRLLPICWKLPEVSSSRQVTWRSGYCYLNKGEFDLNPSKDDSFVKRVAENNSWNNGDLHKIHEIFLINCFVFVITLVWKTVHSSAVT